MQLMTTRQFPGFCLLDERRPRRVGPGRQQVPAPSRSARPCTGFKETLAMPTRAWSGGARAWALFVLGTLTCLALAPMPRLRAQDAKPEAKADPAPAVEEAAPAPAPAASAAPSEGTAPPRQKSLLRWAIEASGPIGIFLLC